MIRRLAFYLTLAGALILLALGTAAAIKARPCRLTREDCRELESDLSYLVRAEIERSGYCTVPPTACGGERGSE